MNKNWKKKFVHVTLNSSSSSISFEMLFIGFWVIEMTGTIFVWVAGVVGVSVLEGDFDTDIEWELMWEFGWELVLVFKLEFMLVYILVFILEFLSKLEEVIILEFKWEFLSGIEGEFILLFAL